MRAVQTLGSSLFKRVIGMPKSAEALMYEYAVTGKARYLERLYDQYADRLYHFVLTLSAPDIAAEIAQRTWVKVIEQRHRFRECDSFTAWLFTIARNTLIDELRKQQRLVYDNESLSKVVAPQPVKEQDVFYACLRTLPFQQQEALSLFLEGFSMQDIAAICQCPKETIKTRIRYAKETLRKKMGGTDEG